MIHATAQAGNLEAASGVGCGVKGATRRLPDKDRHARQRIALWIENRPVQLPAAVESDVGDDRSPGVGHAASGRWVVPWCAVRRRGRVDAGAGQNQAGGKHHAEGDIQPS